MLVHTSSVSLQDHTPKFIDRGKFLARKVQTAVKRAPKKTSGASEKAAASERRRFERAPIQAQVEYELTNSSSGPSRVRRHMANISTGGLFITTEERLRAGTRMVVRFELPNKHRVIAVSRVSYIREGVGVGVEFLNLDTDDFEEIHSYIASLKESA